MKQFLLLFAFLLPIAGFSQIEKFIFNLDNFKPNQPVNIFFKNNMGSYNTTDILKPFRDDTAHYSIYEFNVEKSDNENEIIGNYSRISNYDNEGVWLAYFKGLLFNEIAILTSKKGNIVYLSARNESVDITAYRDWSEKIILQSKAIPSIRLAQSDRTATELVLNYRTYYLVLRTSLWDSENKVDLEVFIISKSMNKDLKAYLNFDESL